MTKCVTLIAALAAAACAQSVDWPVARAGPGQTGAQERESILGQATIHHAELLWKRQINSASLTTPLTLGRLITHRGFQELLFVASRSGVVSAIDADLNRVLWTRRLPAEPGVCDPSLTATPVFPPLPERRIDDDEDNPFPIRPVYVLGGDGRLFTLHPMTGDDMAQPLRFVPPGVKPRSLNIAGQSLFASGSGTCGAEQGGVYMLDRRTRAVTSWHPADGPAMPVSPVALSRAGKAFLATRNAVYAFAAGTLTPTGKYNVAGASLPVVFQWGDREVIAALAAGTLLLLDQDLQVLTRVPAQAAQSLTADRDAVGNAWLYCATGGKTVQAFRLNVGTSINAVPAWTARLSTSSVVAGNGLLYALSTERSTITTRALDAATGTTLLVLPAVPGTLGASGGLSLANGHLCFGTAEGTLYCFGLPVDL